MLGGGDLTTPAVTDTSPAAPSTSEVTEPTTSETAEITTTPPDTEPLPPPDRVISFAACGDNILYRPAIWEAKDRAKAGGRTYNFRPIYKNVESVIAAADVAFINQETVIAGAEYGYTGYPLFNSPRDIADDLVDMGFDIVSLANNHILDMREQGLYNTIKYWNGLPVVTVGAYLNADDEATLRIVERNGVKIAVLAYTYGANGRVVASDSPLVVPFYKEPHKNYPNYDEIFEEKLRTEVARAKNAADVVLVSVHWGYEDKQTPNEEQRKVAQILCDAGADIILGHHRTCCSRLNIFRARTERTRRFVPFRSAIFLPCRGTITTRSAGCSHLICASVPAV